MDSDADNGFYNDIIEYEADNPEGSFNCSAEKRKKRSSKTKPLQYRKLQFFMQNHPDFTKGKANPTQLSDWEKLCVELNAIGPPQHSSIDWRRVWTDFKASHKRMLSSEDTSVIVIVDNNDQNSSEIKEGSLLFLYFLSCEFNVKSPLF